MSLLVAYYLPLAKLNASGSMAWFGVSCMFLWQVAQPTENLMLNEHDLRNLDYNMPVYLSSSFPKSTDQGDSVRMSPLLATI